ncbi:hypothetical protein DFH09DRAFT_1092427 [Mycena vulgaris]|nr:hypothetical protein DFH09DRAFT_1092427 [Mycena vulgaris]
MGRFLVLATTDALRRVDAREGAHTSGYSEFRTFESISGCSASRVAPLPRHRHATSYSRVMANDTSTSGRQSLHDMVLNQKISNLTPLSDDPRSELATENMPSGCEPPTSRVRTKQFGRSGKTSAPVLQDSGQVKRELSAYEVTERPDNATDPSRAKKYYPLITPKVVAVKGAIRPPAIPASLSSSAIRIFNDPARALIIKSGSHPNVKIPKKLPEKAPAFSLPEVLSSFHGAVLGRTRIGPAPAQLSADRSIY